MRATLVLAMAIWPMVLAVAERGAAGQANSAESPAPPPNPAPPQEGEDNAWEQEPATWRSGFVLGLSGGLQFGGASGYPNDLGKIDDPNYRARLSGAGSGGALWIGGALTDWFTFGLGAKGATVQHGDLISSGGAFIIHVEAFPLFRLGGHYRDLGVFTDVGVGGSTIRNKAGTTKAEGGAMSNAGLGVVWEAWRWKFLGHLVAGPFASFDYASSTSLASYLGTVGLRMVYYGGP